MRSKSLLHLLVLLIVGSTTTFGLGTAFIYHGALRSSSEASNGRYDLRFTLHTNASSGLPIGSTITNMNIAVSNGVFSTEVDFGPGVFDGTEYWLEIGVRTNDNSLAFTTLTPRQKLTPSPYASYAPNAGMATTASSVVSNGVRGDSIQNGSIALEKIADNAVTAAKLASDAASLAKVSAGALMISNGNVGLGTVSTNRLAVAGIVESVVGGFKFPDGTVQNSAAGGSGAGSGLPNGTQEFAVPGTNDFTVPTGITRILVECWGAGGTGGGAYRNLSSGYYGGGGGGGAGGYSRKIFTVSPGETYRIVINTPFSGSGEVGKTSFLSPAGSRLLFANRGSDGQGGYTGYDGGAGGAGDPSATIRRTGAPGRPGQFPNSSAKAFGGDGGPATSGTIGPEAANGGDGAPSDGNSSFGSFGGNGYALIIW